MNSNAQDSSALRFVEQKHSTYGRWRMLDLKYFRELLCAQLGDAQRPAIAPTFKPSTVQAESEKKRAETPCQVIAPLTPIQTGPVKYPSRTRKRMNFKSKFFVQEIHSAWRELSTSGSRTIKPRAVNASAQAT